ncbi:hypothetical protein P7C71_g2545, partial [Lecanoromycetidae sp. Uapishka_2]
MHLLRPLRSAASLLALANVALSLPPALEGGHALLPRTGDPRDVYVVFKHIPNQSVQLKTGESEFPGHSALWIQGTQKDGWLQFEFYHPSGSADPDTIEIRMLDSTPEFSTDAVPAGAVKGGWKEPLLQGSISLTNVEIVGDDGSGPIQQALAQDETYRYGPKYDGNLNTCHNFVQKIVKQLLSHDVDPKSQGFMGVFDRLNTDEDINKHSYQTDVTNMQEFNPAPNKGDAPVPKRRWEADPNEECGRRFRPKDKRASCGFRFKPSTKPGPLGGFNELVSNDLFKTFPPDELDIAASDTFGAKSLASTDLSDADKTEKVGLVRNGGVLKTFTSLSKPALAALGIAGQFAGAAFVILDFVDHDWQGAAIGAIGLAAGIGVEIAISGPIGWVIGAAIALFFALLPGAFNSAKDPADMTDVQGIIQRQFFGEKTITGNEQCQKGTDQIPGNPNCQALYGAGTVAGMLGMTNFDAIVFLINFNAGYAMSIPEIAQNFYVADPTKPNDGSDKVAVINCNNNKCTTAQKAGCIGGDSPKVCNNPTFKVNEANVNLPVLDQQADKVLARVIPAPNGDCKLVSYPGDQIFPDYGFTINGLPSDITCGLTASENVDGTAIPIPGSTPNGQNPETGSNPGQSTNGQSGDFVAPPAPAPFAPITQQDYLCIYKDGGPPFCLPPGTYQKQSGLGFEIKDVNALSLPTAPGWSLDVHYEDFPEPHDPRPQGHTDQNTNTNISPSIDKRDSDDFHDLIQGVDVDTGGQAYIKVNAPGDGPIPVCCLFSEVNFGGNVLCLAEGGGDLPTDWQDLTQSVSCHDGGSVWLYCTVVAGTNSAYGDPAGNVISGNNEDLSKNPYGGGKASFSQNVKAVWVTTVSS